MQTSVQLFRLLNTKTGLLNYNSKRGFGKSKHKLIQPKCLIWILDYASFFRMSVTNEFNLPFERNRYDAHFSLFDLWMYSKQCNSIRLWTSNLTKLYIQYVTYSKKITFSMNETSISFFYIFESYFIHWQIWSEYSESIYNIITHDSRLRSVFMNQVCKTHLLFIAVVAVLIFTCSNTNIGDGVRSSIQTNWNLVS